MKSKLHYVILSVLMIGSTFPVYAQVETPSTQAAGQISEDPLPQGYAALILDWESVSMRMSMEQRVRKGAYWPTWLRAGLQEGNSLYWWLLAQWHHNEGNQDLAYRTMLTAWVLTRMEAATCIAPNHPIIRNLLHKHEQILRNGTTTNKAKQEAVLYSLNTAEAMISTDPLRGMICNIEPTRQALERQRAARERWDALARAAAQAGRSPPPWKPGPPRTLIDHKIVPDESRKKAIVGQQKHALALVGSEFKVNQAREAADVNIIMKAMQAKQAH